MTNVPRGNDVVSSGSGIGPMPTQTSNTRLSYLAGSWKQENNVPYHEIPGPTPDIVNASSTILKLFFSSQLSVGIARAGD